MNGLRTYNYRCRNEECGFVQDRIVRYEERYEPHTCEQCGFESLFTPCSPLVLTASWPSGYRRQNHPEWQQLKEASKLKMERASNLKRKNKQDIDKEIKSLGKKK